jgi:hypothetical protein
MISGIDFRHEELHCLVHCIAALTVHNIPCNMGNTGIKEEKRPDQAIHKRSIKVKDVMRLVAYFAAGMAEEARSSQGPGSLLGFPTEGD